MMMMPMINVENMNIFGNSSVTCGAGGGSTTAGTVNVDTATIDQTAAAAAAATKLSEQLLIYNALAKQSNVAAAAAAAAAVVAATAAAANVNVNSSLSTAAAAASVAKCESMSTTMSEEEERGVGNTIVDDGDSASNLLANNNQHLHHHHHHHHVHHHHHNPDSTVKNSMPPAHSTGSTGVVKDEATMTREHEDAEDAEEEEEDVGDDEIASMASSTSTRLVVDETITTVNTATTSPITAQSVATVPSNENTMATTTTTKSNDDVCTAVDNSGWTTSGTETIYNQQAAWTVRLGESIVVAPSLTRDTCAESGSDRALLASLLADGKEMSNTADKSFVLSRYGDTDDSDRVARVVGIVCGGDNNKEPFRLLVRYFVSASASQLRLTNRFGFISPSCIKRACKTERVSNDNDNDNDDDSTLNVYRVCVDVDELNTTTTIKDHLGVVVKQELDVHSNVRN